MIDGAGRRALSIVDDEMDDRRAAAIEPDAVDAFERRAVTLLQPNDLDEEVARFLEFGGHDGRVIDAGDHGLLAVQMLNSPRDYGRNHAPCKGAGALFR